MGVSSHTIKNGKLLTYGPIGIVSSSTMYGEFLDLVKALDLQLFTNFPPYSEDGISNTDMIKEIIKDCDKVMSILNNPHIQEKLFKELKKINEPYLKKYNTNAKFTKDMADDDIGTFKLIIKSIKETGQVAIDENLPFFIC